MVRTRTVGGRFVTVAVVVASATLLFSSCATGATGAVPPTSTTAVATPEPAGRTVPTPVDGTLRARLPASESPLAEGPAGVLVFGDSVAVLIADELARELSGELHVDGIDCRRLDIAFTGPCGGVPAGTSVPSGLDALRDVVADLGRDGVQLDAAVVVVANNAALHADVLDAAMDVLAPVPRVWWVTTDVEGRGWRDPNNALLADLAERDPRAGLVDWHAAAEGQDWRADHVHPNDAGQVALAGLVADHLRCDCVP